MRRIAIILLLILSPGCATSANILDLLMHVFDNETVWEREDRMARNEGWKNYWRSNPDVNPAMTEAYSD